MTSSQPLDFEMLDLAWQEFYRAEGSNPEPAVREFLSPDLAGEDRVVALVSLVAVDQGYRWKPRSSLANPVERRGVAGYLAEWPELNRPDIILKLLNYELEYRTNGDELTASEVLQLLGNLTGTRIEGPKRAELPAPPPNAPTIPEYRLIRKLGKGGQGNVWLARRGNGPEEAVKVLERADTEDLIRFNQEITALCKLHEEGGEPSIVRISDWNINNPPYYFAMEYCPEGSVEQLLAERKPRPLAPREAAKLVKYIALGLDKTHNTDIVSERLSGKQEPS